VRMDEGRSCSFHYRLPPSDPKHSGARDYTYLEAGCDITAKWVEADVLKTRFPMVTAVGSKK